MKINYCFLVWLGLLAGGSEAWAGTLTPPQLAREVIQAMQSGQAAQYSAATIASNATALRNALPTYPKDATIRFALGSCYMQQHKADEARVMLGQAYALAPGDAEIGMTYVVALKADRQLLKARDTARQLSQAHPKAPQFQITLATLDIAIQQYHDAITVLDPLFAHAPPDLAKQDRGVMYYLLGTCYLHLGKRTNALATLKKADELFPHAATILCALAEATLKNGDAADARDYLDQTLAINPRMPGALFLRGIMMERAGAPDKARRYFEACYKLGKVQLPDNGEDYYRMAMVCAKLNKTEESRHYQAEAAQMLYTTDAPWALK